MANKSFLLLAEATAESGVQQSQDLLILHIQRTPHAHDIFPRHMGVYHRGLEIPVTHPNQRGTKEKLLNLVVAINALKIKRKTW